MGSKITRAIYKNERQKPVLAHSTLTAVRLLSIVLYAISTIFVGYIFDIDLILKKDLESHYKLANGMWPAVL